MGVDPASAQGNESLRASRWALEHIGDDDFKSEAKGWRSQWEKKTAGRAIEAKPSAFKNCAIRGIDAKTSASVPSFRAAPQPTATTMKKSPVPALLAIGFATFQQASAAPPFAGTIFVSPNIITASDPTVFQNVVAAGQGIRSMFDRRVNGFVSLNAFLFNASFSGGSVIEIQVNPEFGNAETAEMEASKYGEVIGRLPACLRADVQTVWIHQGTEPFGGGNNNLLIHTGQADLYSADGILEETLVHEATHTSLDVTHAAAPGWLAAQGADNEFISTYARDFPASEDVAETFLLYLALRYRPDRIGESLANTISATIPGRIAYFDGVTFDLNPLVPPAPFAITGFAANSSTGNLALTWKSRPGHDYAVEISTDLMIWSDLVTGIASQGPSTSLAYTGPLPNGKAFFKVRESPAP